MFFYEVCFRQAYPLVMHIFRSKWPANVDVFSVVANPKPKSNYFSSGEKRQKEIHLCSHART